MPPVREIQHPEHGHLIDMDTAYPARGFVQAAFAQSGLAFGMGVAVGSGVEVGSGVFVGDGVLVGSGRGVGVGVRLGSRVTVASAVGEPVSPQPDIVSATSTTANVRPQIRIFVCLSNIAISLVPYNKTPASTLTMGGLLLPQSLPPKRSCCLG